MTMSPLPFYHSTVFTTEQPNMESRQSPQVKKVEKYYHDGYEKQYTVLNRNVPKEKQVKKQPKKAAVSSRRKSEYSVSLENGHSYFKIGASEGKMSVMKKKDDKKSRSKKMFPTSRPASEPLQRLISIANGEKVEDDVNETDYEDGDYDSLIRQGTITEFLKI